MLCSSCGSSNVVDSASCVRCGQPLGSSSPTRVASLPDAGGALAGAPSDPAFALRYVIQSLLGKGGVGVVYRARDLTLDEEIAIKVLQADPHRDPRELER